VPVLLLSGSAEDWPPLDCKG